MRRMVLAVLLSGIAGPAAAQALTPAEVEALRAEIAAQRRTIQAQEQRLRALEDRLLGEMRGTGAAPAGTQVAQAPAPAPVPAATPEGGVQPVGEAPREPVEEPQVAVLAESGGVITRRGRLTVEGSVEYARADRNRIIFRGIEVPQSVLVGVFNIDESRQDVLTAAGTLRLGVTNRFEVNARVPYIYRSDVSVLAPARVNPNSNDPATVLDDDSAKGNGLGDIEFGARYQLTNGTGGWPFLIAGISAVAPTGSDPFKVPRAGDGRALKTATGGGFWGVSPTITALLPTDPAVLFGTIGYTFNFARNLGGQKLNDDVLIDYVDPGNAISASAGIGLSLNQRTSISFAYAHQWSFGTLTRGRAIQRPPGGVEFSEPFEDRLRDLQVGRFMFGVSYRANADTTINWNVEMGATDDATDLRTTLRVPFFLNAF